MEYNSFFNTPMVIFTAFNGEMVSDMKTLTWIRKSPSEFGSPSNSSSMLVYSNGTSFLASGYANSTGNYSYYNLATNNWTPSFTSKAKMNYCGNGVYLLVNGSSIYCSSDGQSLRYSGILPQMGSPVMCGASNGTYGVISSWSAYSPVYIKSNVFLTNNWTLSGNYHDNGICCFSSMTYHKGRYVGVASDTIRNSGKGGIQKSANGLNWVRTIQKPFDLDEGNGNNFSAISSIGNKLFLLLYYYPVGSNTAQYRLAVMNDSATSYKVVLNGMNMNCLKTLVYVQKEGLFFLFGNNVVYSSPDGFHWKMIPQSGFSGEKNHAIYIPSVGFYVTVLTSSTTYFSAYP